MGGRVNVGFEHSHTMPKADASKSDAVVDIVADVMPEHFLPPSRLAEMFARLQRLEVAELIQNRSPESAQLKSGDLREVLCATFVREKTPFKLGIKRLQFKDHRNMSMQGDDMLGFNLNPVTGKLTVLNAESKSDATMPAATVTRAREALSGYGELPSPHSLGSVADRLLDPADKSLRDAIDDAQLKKSLKPGDVTRRRHAHAIHLHGQRHDHAAAIQLEWIYRKRAHDKVAVRPIGTKDDEETCRDHQRCVRATRGKRSSLDAGAPSPSTWLWA